MHSSAVVVIGQDQLVEACGGPRLVWRRVWYMEYEILMLLWFVCGLRLR